MTQSNSADSAEETPPPPIREFVKPTTLHGLLQALCLIDEAMLEIDLNQQVELFDNGRVKVDNYKYLIDKMKVMLVDMQQKKREYAEACSTLQNNIESLQNHMVFALQSNKFSEFAGNEYKARLQYMEYVELKHSVPGDGHALHYGQFIKTTREWKLTPIKNALKAEKVDPKLAELASLEKRAHIRFSVMKDV